MYKVDAMICLEQSPQRCLELIDESIGILLQMTPTPDNIGYICHHESVLLNNRAIVLIMLDNKHEADQNLSQALRVEVNRASVFNRCTLYLAAGKIQEATSMWLSMRQIPLGQDVQFYMGLYQDLVVRDQVEPFAPIESHVSGSVSSQQERWMDMQVLKPLIERKLLQEAAAASISHQE